MLPAVAFTFLAAAVDVYAGDRFQTANPATVATIAFSAATCVFIGIEVGRHGVSALRPLRTHGRDVIAINVTTVVTWLTIYFSLKYLNPLRST